MMMLKCIDQEGMLMKAKANSRARSVPAATEGQFSALNAQELQIREDYEWCLHDPVVRRKYGGKVVVAHRGVILGVGRNHTEAWRAAKRNPACPGNDRVAFVAVPEAIA
jgi:hypothetical protein